MAYKLVQCKGTVSSISDAFSALEELGGEMRETYDNMEGANMGHMEKCQSAGEAADTLEGFSEPEVPVCLQGMDLEYTEAVNKRKGAGCLRAVRLGNACNILRAAADAASDFAENKTDEEGAKADAEQFADDCNQIADEAEGVEFPGMFG